MSWRRMGITPWADIMRPIIAKELSKCKGKSEEEIMQILKEAYPWYPKDNNPCHPYKIWLVECNKQIAKLNLENKETTSKN